MKSYFTLLLISLFLSACSTATEETTLSRPEKDSIHLIEDGDNIIHVRTFGEGAPLLIINGGPGMSSEGFAGLAELLSKHHQAIIYDQRGTGKSTIPTLDSTTVSLDLMVADIEKIRKHFGFEQWAVLGHSFGGMLVSYYATQHPEAIKGIIMSSSGGVDMDLFNVLDITGRLSQDAQDSLNYWTQKINSGADTSYYARLKRGTFLAPAYLYDTTFVPVVAHRLTQGNMQLNTLVFQNMFKIKYDCKEQLKGYTSPVLIIQGQQDIIPASIAEKAAELLEDSKLVIIDECAHYGWLEQPEIYLGEIEAFLSSL